MTVFHLSIPLSILKPTIRFARAEIPVSSLYSQLLSCAKVASPKFRAIDLSR